MKITNKGKEDIDFYLRVSHLFDFDGTKDYADKAGNLIIKGEEGGVSAEEAFFCYDSNGRILPTSEPEKLKLLLKTKGSVNLHIKMYAEDRANGRLPKIEFDKICEEFKLPQWFIAAVETQKYKYYKDASLI